MMALFFISLWVFIAGVAGAIIKYGGIPTSVSDIYYLLPPKKRVPIFYGWICLVAIPLMILWLDITENQTFQFLVFLSCAGLLFVGAAGDFKQKLTQKVHIGGALICAISAILWVFIYTNIWMFVLVFLVLFSLFGVNSKGIIGSINGPVTSRNTLIFFIELTAFLSTYLGIWSFMH